MATLIGELASENFREREAATMDLWEIGDTAIKALREASSSEDPEVSMRAAALLEKVELAITPETPAEILSLIQRYQAVPQNQKANILNELKRKKAYFQVMKLVFMEPPGVREELMPNIRGVAVNGAREAIMKEDFKTAIRFLEMSATGEDELMPLACLYRTMGRLENGKEFPAAPENVPTDLWRITLLRAKGDLAAAAKIAGESKRMRLYAGLMVLEGDPTLWLNQNGLGNRDEEANEAYIEIALKRWEGKKVREAAYAPLLQLLNSKDENDRIHGITSMAALGKLEVSEAAYAKEQLSLSFAYLSLQERVGDALELFGLDPKNPDYKTWAEARFKKISHQNDEDDDDQSTKALDELQTIAAFLEQRGLKKELETAYSPFMKKYALEDEGHFLDFLKSLAQENAAPRFAMNQGAIWAGEDEKRWDELFTVILGEVDIIQEWLAWTREIEPKMEKAETLEAMLIIFNTIKDSGDTREKWMEKFWAATERADKGIKETYLKRILTLSIAMQDVKNALKAYEQLGEASIWSSADKFLTAAGRWGEASDILENLVAAKKSLSPEFHAYIAANLRRAGKEKEAAEHDAIIEKLALGSARADVVIASYYSYGGDEERAAKWFRRAACEVEPTDNEFAGVLDTYATSMMESRNWAIAASCYEAYVQISASAAYSSGRPADYAKLRLNADLAKALAILPQDKERAVDILDAIHKTFITDGVLADDFFPLVRQAGLKKELDVWFYETWGHIVETIATYPDYGTARNTAAWFASRSGMELEKAGNYLATALEKSPNEPAYLDTMAELSFAKGDRKAAVKWSTKSLMFYPLTDRPFDAAIRKQHHRFETDPLPR